jgi:hypothetical protein
MAGGKRASGEGVTGRTPAPGHVPEPGRVQPAFGVRLRAEEAPTAASSARIRGVSRIEAPDGSGAYSFAAGVATGMPRLMPLAA